MRRALIISHNLIGDTLVAGIALRDWFKRKGGDYDEIDLLTNNDHVKVLYPGLGGDFKEWFIEWSHIFTSDEEVNNHVKENRDGIWSGVYDDQFTLGAGDAGKFAEEHKCHIVEGFYQQLGLEPFSSGVKVIDTPLGSFKEYCVKYNPWATLINFEINKIPNLFQNYILFAPFSASCSSRKGEAPNEMLRPECWTPIIEYLRRLGPIRMLGAPDDRPEPAWQLSEEEIMTGVPLDWLAAVVQQAKLVVTIDNGMGHLADSQNAKHILFYPQCLALNFIINWGNKNLIPIQIDPVSVQEYQLLGSIKRFVRQFGVQ